MSFRVQAYMNRKINLAEKKVRTCIKIWTWTWTNKISWMLACLLLQDAAYDHCIMLLILEGKYTTVNQDNGIAHN